MGCLPPMGSRNLSLGPGPVIALDYPLEEAAGTEGGFEEEAAYPAFGKEVDSSQEPKRRTELASGVITELVSGTYRWGLAPVIDELLILINSLILFYKLNQFIELPYSILFQLACVQQLTLLFDPRKHIVLFQSVFRWILLISLNEVNHPLIFNHPLLILRHIFLSSSFTHIPHIVHSSNTP